MREYPPPANSSEFLVLDKEHLIKLIVLTQIKPDLDPILSLSIFIKTLSYLSCVGQSLFDSEKFTYLDQSGAVPKFTIFVTTTRSPKEKAFSPLN